MTSQPTKRFLALLVSAALLASLTAATVAAPASAAKPKCQGKTATIVGTGKGEVIRGTAKRDVIVAKGGNDRIFGRGGNDLICGGAGADLIAGNAGIDKIIGNGGPDRLFGGAGPDRLFAGVGNDLALGGPGNDVVDGGPGTDTCYQNLGGGPLARCELPAAPAAPVVQAPTPTPTPTPKPDTDGDGVTDDVDACPNEGDRGWGLDVDGCPNPPLTLTYSALAGGLWSPSAVWSGLEPGSNLVVRWEWGDSAAFQVIYSNLNSTGSGSYFDPSAISADCQKTGQPLVSATLTATEAGGTEQQYPMPLPDSSICP